MAFLGSQFCILYFKSFKEFLQLAEDRNLFEERKEKLIKELQLLRVILIINRTDAICLAWLLHSFICSFRNIIRHVGCEGLLLHTCDTKMIRHKVGDINVNK